MPFSPSFRRIKDLQSARSICDGTVAKHGRSSVDGVRNGSWSIEGFQGVAADMHEPNELSTGSTLAMDRADNRKR